MTEPRDEDGAGLGRLLTDLADDPDAPPSSVSAVSVIAAAKRPRDEGPPVVSPTVGAMSGSGGVPAVRSADPSAGTSAPDAGASVGELHVLSVQQDADRRARRRRTMIFGGLAAACAVAVAAVVIPIAVSNSSSTTSAGSAADQSPAQAPAPAESADAPSADAEAPADQGSGAGAAVPPVDPSNPDANRPPPGENALSQAVPVPGGTAPTGGTGAGGADAGGGATASCWPALSDAASAALVGALPAGMFGAPGPLGLGCPADPVGGSQLAGTAPDTQLVVRVTRADPGACAQSASETGARCVARGADQYVANDAGNLSVYAYGNGYEVEVGGRPATGIAPIPSGMTADQLSAAAAAVLGTLG